MKNVSSYLSDLNFWRKMTSFWTIILFSVIFWDFATNNNHADVVSAASAIYVVVLSIFSADKEFERWKNHYSGTCRLCREYTEVLF